MNDIEKSNIKISSENQNICNLSAQPPVLTLNLSAPPSKLAPVVFEKYSSQSSKNSLAPPLSSGGAFYEGSTEFSSIRQFWSFGMSKAPKNGEYLNPVEYTYQPFHQKLNENGLGSSLSEFQENDLAPFLLDVP